MTIEDLKALQPDIFSGKEIESCELSKIKENENKEKFKYRGVYLLIDESGQIVYIGSAYARDVRERLMQYQQKEGSGNSTLYKDLEDSGKTKKGNTYSYVISLTASAFKDESNEYKLIQCCNSAVNIAGK